jgi:hypothetical protein
LEIGCLMAINFSNRGLTLWMPTSYAGQPAGGVANNTGQGRPGSVGQSARSRLSANLQRWFGKGKRLSPILTPREFNKIVVRKSYDSTDAVGRQWAFDIAFVVVRFACPMTARNQEAADDHKGQSIGRVQ